MLLSDTPLGSYGIATLSRAGAAVAMLAAVRVAGILWREFVPMIAMRAGAQAEFVCCVGWPPADPTSEVFPTRDQFQVRGINAAAHAAQMVQVHRFRLLAVKPFPGEHVSVSSGFSHPSADPGVAIVRSSSKPKMAPRVRFGTDKISESFVDVSTCGHPSILSERAA